MNQEAAAKLPLEGRVAAYAKAHNLRLGSAYDALCELGLQAVLEAEFLKHGPEWLPPVYLYASYLRLMGEVNEANKGAAPEV